MPVLDLVRRVVTGWRRNALPPKSPQCCAPYPLRVEIEPGMILCLESDIGSAEAGEGVKLEDQFLVHEDRVERLFGYRFDEKLGGS